MKDRPRFRRVQIEKEGNLSDVNTIALSIYLIIYLSIILFFIYSYSFRPRDFYPSERFSVTLLVLLF